MFETTNQYLMMVVNNPSTKPFLLSIKAFFRMRGVDRDLGGGGGGPLDSHDHMSHGQKCQPYFPWNPGCFNRDRYHGCKYNPYING